MLIFKIFLGFQWTYANFLDIFSFCLHIMNIVFDLIIFSVKNETSKTCLHPWPDKEICIDVKIDDNPMASDLVNMLNWRRISHPNCKEKVFLILLSFFFHFSAQTSKVRFCSRSSTQFQGRVIKFFSNVISLHAVDDHGSL